MEIESEDLSGSRFSRVRLAGSRFERVEFDHADFWEVDLSDSRLIGVSLERTQIWGEVDGLSINGVDIAPMLNSELDRRYPEHALLKPIDAAGYRQAWSALQAVWADTIGRAADLPADTVQASVGGEWSFVQTLRHVSFAITSWLDGAILGDPSPWNPLDLPWDQMPPHPDVPWDKDSHVTLGQARGLYDASVARLSAYLEQLSDDQLDQQGAGSPNPNWPDERADVAECLRVILNEAFWHHRFAVRDLDALDQPTDN